ncbi:MAG: hypothetical protein IH617_00870 [Hydrogenophaga sp.]|nr:hypothetical protein [Hydrogenophaga sp.]
MIYVHRDWSAVPQPIKDALIAAAQALDAIADQDARKQYIKDNGDKWAAVREYLNGMSHNKCWYSEAKERVSRYQVDHYRPHGRAKQALRTFAEGYSWLAFDLDNFRLAGVLCNTANKEHSTDTVGKSDWFPLADPTKRACLTARDCSIESPLLLDPVDPDDPCKLIFNDDGSVRADPNLPEDVQADVSLAIGYLGLSQGMLNGARKGTWRRCARAIIQYNRIAKKRKGDRTQEEAAMLVELREELVGMSKASSEFAAVARCCLRAHKLDQFIIPDELIPLAAKE